MSTQNRKQGFTLIELMIVVAVIGILAAALVPNLLGARQQAVQAQVEACARSIQTAQTVYVGSEGNYAQTQADLEQAPYEGFLACEFSQDAIQLSPSQNQPANGYSFELDHSNAAQIVVVTDADVTTQDRP